MQLLDYQTRINSNESKRIQRRRQSNKCELLLEKETT